MVFWLAVLVGGLFAWIAVQVGFYAAWIMFFNLVLAAYMALFLTPVIAASVPDATETSYGYALVLMSVAIATLLIVYGICYACLSGRLRFAFPRALDNVGAGVLGFMSGFLVLSFVAFALAITPLSEIDVVKSLGFGARSQKANTSYMCWWCNRFHSMVSTSSVRLTSQQIVGALLATVKEQEKDKEQKSDEPKGGEEKTPAATEPKPAQPAAAAETTSPLNSQPDAKAAPAKAEENSDDAEKAAAPSESPAKAEEGPKATNEPAPTIEPKPADVAHKPAPTPPPRAGVPSGVKPLPGSKSTAASEGPFSGVWQASAGAQFRLNDDGKTITVDLISSDTLQLLAGKLTRTNGNAESKTLAGVLDVILAVDTRRQFIVDTKMTIIDSNHLRLRCADWPKWGRGKVEKGVLTELWTRSTGVPEGPVQTPLP